MNTKLLLITALATAVGCGETSSNQAPAQAPKVADKSTEPTATPVDCGLIDEWAGPNLCAANREAVFKCFVDAHAAGRPARFVSHETGDDSRLDREWTASKGEIVILTKDSNGSAPQTQRCPSTKIETAASGCKVLATQGCS